MRRRRAPIILVAIVSFVALVANLPAQAELVEKRRVQIPVVGLTAEGLLGGEDLDGDVVEDRLSYKGSSD